MSDKYYEIKNTYYKINFGLGGVLYQPIEESEKSKVAVVLLHSDGDYYGFTPGPELAKRGYTTFGSKVNDSRSTLDKKIEDVGDVINFVKSLPGIEKIVILGHSGGATLMTCYAAVAENGPEIFRDDHRIIKMGNVKPLPLPDAMMILDANWGNGVMTLISVDPAITDENSARNLNEELDLYNPANGFSEDGSHYSDEFVAKFQKAQAARNEKIVDAAIERLKLIEAGQGNYDDDEPFIVPAASQLGPCNKMFPQDVRLLSHTINEWPLIHADGSITNEVVYTRRLPRGGKNPTTQMRWATLNSTVKSFLTNCGLRTKDFHYDESRMYGIDWDSCYCTPAGNIKYVKMPTLLMGMAGGYEFLAAEQIYEAAVNCENKTLVFVEGASHNFFPVKEAEKFPGEFGDTVKNTFDYAADWLDKLFF